MHTENLRSGRQADCGSKVQCGGRKAPLRGGASPRGRDRGVHHADDLGGGLVPAETGRSRVSFVSLLYGQRTLWFAGVGRHSEGQAKRKVSQVEAWLSAALFILQRTHCCEVLYRGRRPLPRDERAPGGRARPRARAPQRAQRTAVRTSAKYAERVGRRGQGRATKTAKKIAGKSN